MVRNLTGWVQPPVERAVASTRTKALVVTAPLAGLRLDACDP